MSAITYAQATIEAMKEEMERDSTVFLMGEDIRTAGSGFGRFTGLADQFSDRVLDCPISETAIVGSAVGAAMAGMRPVVDMHFADFFATAMDEISNQMAKIRYMFGGQAKIPMVIRTPQGISRSAAAHHSQSPEAWFMHLPGVQVVFPSGPIEAKALLKSAIRSNNPVILLESHCLLSLKEEMPEGDFVLPIGKANVVKEGKDITIVSYGGILRQAVIASAELSKDGIDAEVIDLRTISPIDKETIFASVKKTGRLLIAHEAVKQGGVGAEISALVAEEILDYLDAPIMRVGAPFTPVPFSPALESIYKIGSVQIIEAAKKLF